MRWARRQSRLPPVALLPLLLVLGYQSAIGYPTLADMQLVSGLASGCWHNHLSLISRLWTRNFGGWPSLGCVLISPACARSITSEEVSPEYPRVPIVGHAG